MKNFNILIFILIELISIIVFVDSRCSMGQDENQIPRPANESEKEPHTIHSDNSYCPDFEGMYTCCTDYQLKELEKNFMAIESIFGGDDGCDICAVNLKRFWCHFACDPNQEDFLEVGDLTNYTIDGKDTLLRDITFHLNEDTNYELFKSCKKTKFVTQIPSMGNAIGFTNFQGINVHSKIPVYVTMKIDNNKGLSYDNDPCNLEIPENNTVRGYKNISKCTCNSCQYSCDYNFDSSITVLNGINSTLIIVFYVCIFVATIGLFFFKKKCGSDQNDSLYETNIEGAHFSSRTTQN